MTTKPAVNLLMTQRKECGRIANPVHLDPQENFWLGEWDVNVLQAFKNWSHDYDGMPWIEREKSVKESVEESVEKSISHRIDLELVRKNIKTKTVGIFHVSRNKSGAASVKKIS